MIRPLEIAKVYFNFSDFPDKLIYNDQIEIKIFDSEGEEFKLPYYLSNENNLITNKKELIMLRVFNWLPFDQEFSISI